MAYCGYCRYVAVFECPDGNVIEQGYDDIQDLIDLVYWYPRPDYLLVNIY